MGYWFKVKRELMKQRTLKLNIKIFLLNFFILLMSIIGAYFLSHFFYERLYKTYVEATLIDRTERIMDQYENGVEIEELSEKIEWLSSISFGEVFLLTELNQMQNHNNDEAFCACFSESEVQAISEGKVVSKISCVDQSEHDCIIVARPLKKGNVVEGIVLAKTPLYGLNKLTKQFLVIWITLGSIFIGVFSILSVKILNKLIKPFKEMNLAASKVSNGIYDTYIHYDSDDEIGSFAQAFNKMLSKLQEEDERRKDFLSDVSHELRTPLSYIKGYTHVLLDGLVKKPEKQRQYLKLIARETDKMESLVQDLLDLTKIESNSFEMNMHPIVLAQCIEDVMMRYKSILRKKQLSLKMNLDPEVIINGDEIRLEQIIQNVIDNAIQYSISGGILEITLTIQKNQCVLTITDNGIGMSEQDLTKVTERFYRVNKARTRLDGGTGIGLAIVEKLTKLHGGRIVIESQLNVGTKVRLFFPLIEEN